MIGRKETMEQFEEQKKQLERAKQELLFIQEQLEESTPKIDISNIYVWEDNGLYSLVKLETKRTTSIITRRHTSFYESTLTDIFSNNIIYQQTELEPIKRCQYIADGKYYAHLLPLHEVDRNILAFTDKKVPIYVLQQLYYKINNIDVSAYVKKKEK